MNHKVQLLPADTQGSCRIQPAHKSQLQKQRTTWHTCNSDGSHHREVQSLTTLTPRPPIREKKGSPNAHEVPGSSLKEGDVCP